MVPTRPAPTVAYPPQAAELTGPLAGRGLALVLSGGAARGYAHIGVIKVLEEAGIRPDLIVGTSAGSIAGALYASGMNARQIEAVAAQSRDIFASEMDWRRMLQFESLGLFTGNSSFEFVNRQVGGRRIDQLPIPFAVVATDLGSGAAVAFTRGDTGRAVQASCAIPGVFEPVDIEGRLYADGGLSSPLPARVGRALGARVVVAVDVVYPPEHSAKPRSLLGVMFQTFLVQTHRLKEAELGIADLVIAPDIPGTERQYGFDDRAMLIAAGEAAARRALPGLWALLAELP
ncbi:MAG: patatin-like phospholipase family protein [Burkholderiales bacterium]